MADSPSSTRAEMQEARHRTAIAIGVVVGLAALIWTYFITREPVQDAAPKNIPSEAR